MRFYRSTLLAVLFGASAIGSLPNVNAQSFDYPQNSKSIFSRWVGNQNQKVANPQLPSIQLPAPQKGSTAFSLKRLISTEDKARRSKLVERIQAFDTQKVFSVPSPHTVAINGTQATRQTAWASPLTRRQAERSILEVVEKQQPPVASSQPRHQLAPVERINGSGLPKSAPYLDHSRVPVLPGPTQTQAAPNYPTASINGILPERSDLTTTQAMLQRQQQSRAKETVSKNQRSATATPPPRFAKGSFENEFSKAYELIGNDVSRRANSVTPPVRVAQQNSVNTIFASQSGSNRSGSSTDGSAFDLIPESGNGAATSQAPQFNEPSTVALGDFRSPELNSLAPNEDSSFSPPNSMSFEAPDVRSETAFVNPPKAPDDFEGKLEKNAEDFPPVKTSDTWKPPIVPEGPREQMNSKSDSVVEQQYATVETIDEGVAWWKSVVGQPLHVHNNAQTVDTNSLVFEALRSSPLIKSVSKNPLIRELQVVEADAEFDAVRFLNSQFQDRVDPVGNSLTTGGEPFLEDNIWTAEGGIRKRLRNGASFDLSQTLGFQNSNSTFFTPQDQGTATLALNVTQPLLRGRGRYVNQAQILIAQSTGSAAWDTFKIELQEELEGMVTAYWDLYLQRSIYLQKQRNVERGQVMLDRLVGRKGLDSLPAQIARAKSAVLTRRTELANAFRDVRNAETEIRRRVADKNWQAAQSIELLPIEMPFAQSNGLELEQVVYTALENRPEIAEAIRRIRIAGVQRDVSANDLLPELSLLLGTYVSSLRGDTGILNAFQDQFGQVTPGYSIGIEYELPYRNRAARSRLQQRNLQLRRLENELEIVIQNVIAESQVATRQVTSAFETLRAARESVVAARVDLVQNQKRWESFALVEGDLADGQSPTIVLDQLLDSQERLAQAENVFAEAEQGLKIAEVSLQRTMGTLLMHQQVDFSRSVNRDTPSIHINKANTPPPVTYFEEVQQEFTSPQFISPQFVEPEFAQQQPVQPRVGELKSILPTPSTEEVTQLMQPPNFSVPAARTKASSRSWLPPKSLRSPKVRPSGYRAESPQILPAGYRSDGSAPQFDFGYPAK